MSDADTTPRVPFLKNGIGQIAVVVEDIDKAVEAYWKILGIGPWRIYTYGKPMLKEMSYRGQPADFKMRVALAKVGPLHFELIQPLEGDTIYAEFVKEHGYGMHHFAVLVEDFEAARAEAEAAGLTLIQHGSGFGLDGDGGFAYFDTESELSATFELLNLPKRRLPPERVYPPGDEA